MALAKDLVETGMRAGLADWLGETVKTSISANGTTQANGTELIASINVVQTANASNYVIRLPKAAQFKGPLVWVKNLTTQDLRLYPAIDEYLDLVQNGSWLVKAKTTVQNWVIAAKISSTGWVIMAGAG